MARAHTSTLLPLDRFAAIVGIHPLHFNQCQVDEIAPPRVCGMPFIQYGWQAADTTGRDDIALAIADAESMFAREAGFWPAPKYMHNEVHVLKMNGVWRITPSVKTDYGYLTAIGALTKSVVSAGAAVVYSDVDGDGYQEVATITVATTVTDPNQICIYYPGRTDDYDEIRPIKVTIAAGVATITCRRELLYLDDLVEILNPRAFDGLDAANFLATVDVYRKYIDYSDQGYLTWLEPLCTQCGGTGCTACVLTVHDICTKIINSRQGTLYTEAATYDAVTDTFTYGCDDCGNPSKATLNYVAGWPLDGRNMAGEMERAITYLAVAQLDRPLCACNNVSVFATQWQEDLALRHASQGSAQSYNFSTKLLDNNPFGTTRAAIYAWRIVQKYKIGEGI
jgi:hypothetical protein